MSAKGIPDVLSKSPEQGIVFNVHRIILGLQFPMSLTTKLLVADWKQHTAGISEMCSKQI
jgi:hypothetical protein